MTPREIDKLRKDLSISQGKRDKCLDRLQVLDQEWMSSGTSGQIVVELIYRDGFIAKGRVKATEEYGGDVP